MPSVLPQNISQILHVWDEGSKSNRAEILKVFIAENSGSTAPELDKRFSMAASLFLTRLTAWLRLTYMSGTYLKLQLESIMIFVSSSSGHKYLAEFLEVGGVLTVLEILGLKQAKEDDKAESLKLLMCIANSGRKYKELICESFGVRAVAECLAKSKSFDTQDRAKYLLQDLATGNPRYEVQIYKALISLLSTASPKAQQLAAETLRYVQGIVSHASPSIVEPTLLLLRSLHVEVQYEASELMKALMNYDIQHDVLQRLVALLKPSNVDMQKSIDFFKEHNLTELDAPLPVFVQQAAAGKCTGILAKESPEIAESLVMLNAIHGLLYAMGNDRHTDSQKQSSIALQFFVRSFPHVDEAVRIALGDSSYHAYMANPDGMYLDMTPIQISVLHNNRVSFSSA